MTLNEERSRQIAEQDDHYERINKMWADTDLPALVWETPNWEDGWLVLEAWFCRQRNMPPPTRKFDDPRFRRWTSFRPTYHATWYNEVHIFSHSLHTEGGHSARHAAI